ncbi:uncharacterized protein LOC141704494 [Apium graveolens]|uniref:Uncharacterized protein n=1 Tax=Apium graveolens TaxID=4045 RepID=A0A6L5B769_APIGR|nr:hypothetical protein AG4045_027429 [Apium graveolens]
MDSSFSAERINLTSILSQTKSIINAHSRHFLALSLISLLPISFLITIYPTLLLQLHSSLFDSHLLNPQTLILISTPNPNYDSPFYHFAPVVFFVIIGFLYVCGVCTVTYSVIHGFYGRPVRLSSSMKSLLRNVIPIVFTMFCGLLFAFLVFAVFGVFLFFVVVSVSFFGGEVEFGFNWLMVLFVIGLVLVLVYVQVHCVLGCVVVVVEGKWGFEALRRSGVLVKGMRLVSLWLLLFGCVTVVFPLWLHSVPLVKFEGGFDFWKSAGFVAQTVLSSSFVTLFMLISISANAVLYMYCKALHGELASEIAEEFARDYVSLPFDDEKVPHIVTVVQA